MVKRAPADCVGTGVGFPSMSSRAQPLVHGQQPFSEETQPTLVARCYVDESRGLTVKGRHPYAQSCVQTEPYSPMHVCF